MGARFEQWLTRPTTLCFLRRLLAAIDRPHGASPRTTARKGPHPRYITSTVRFNDKYGDSLCDTERVPAIHPKARIVPPLRTAEVRHRSTSAMTIRSSSPRESPSPISSNENRGKDKQTGSPVSPANKDAFGNPHSIECSGQVNAGNFWTEMIAKEARLRGFEGIRKIWDATRHNDVALPTESPEADALWTTLLSYCISEENTPEQDLLLQELISHTWDQKQRGVTQWSGLYHYVVGRCLRVRPDSALHWHERLTHDLEIVQVDLNPLAEDCARSLNIEKTRLAFMDIYARSPPQRAYDAFISTLLQHNHPKRDVQLWHGFFIAHDDTPISAGAHSLYEELALARNAQPSSFSQKDHISGKQLLPAFTRATLPTIVDEVHGIKPKKLTDTFVARWLATKAFTLDIVMAGLEFLAIEELGPLATRQLAMRATSCAELHRRLEELKRRGIGIPRSIYASLLETLVAKGQDGLLRALLSSDQHPESFEDRETQHALLQHHLRVGDENMVHITVLALSHASAHASAFAWNAILQFRLTNRDHLAAKSVAIEMQRRGIAFSQYTIGKLMRILLPDRKPGRRPSDVNIGAGVDPDDLSFVTGLFIYTAKKGQHPMPAQWVEILKRHGMTGKWDGLHRLILWLVSFYKTDQTFRSARGMIRPHRPVIYHIFGRQMVEAIVHWGFMTGFPPYQSLESLRNLERKLSEPSSRITAENSWAKGIALVYDLALGSIEDIRRPLKTRLWILFGPGYSNVASNFAIQKENHSSLRHYIEEANRICDGNLFEIEPELLGDDPAQSAALLMAVFGETHSTNTHTRERADVKLWAADQYWHATSEPEMSEGGFWHPSPGRTIMDRKRAWQSSPYRLRRQKRRTITLAS